MLHDLSRAKYEIERFLCHADQWHCTCDGIALGPLETRNLSVTPEFGKLIFSFWGEDFAESWRIEEYQVQEEQLQLELSRRWGRERLRLVVWPHDQDQPLPADIRRRRQRFQEVMCRVIAKRYPKALIERVATRRDDTRHLSGVYTRLLSTRGEGCLIAIGVNAQESQRDVDGLLTAGIIWYNHAKRRSGLNSARLVLLAPAGRATTLARLLTAVHPEPTVKLELLEVDERTAEAEVVQPFDQGSLFDPTRHRLPPTHSALGPNRVREELLKRFSGRMRVYQRPGSRVESLRLRGLEVARIRGGQLWFGVGSDKRRLKGSDLSELEDQIGAIDRLRCPDSPKKWHPFYRQQAERWLEEVVRQDIRALDVRLVPRYVYPQIPTHHDEESRRVDLLAITDRGRLVMIELKVTEDIQLPLQGLDYWLQIEWHRQRHDFQRRGYFPGRTVVDEPAWLFLVSPLLRFHKTFDLVARWIGPGVPAYKVGINGDWRRGLKVLLKERING